MAWIETSGTHVTARHGEADADDVGGVIELLEATHRRLAQLFPAVPDHVAVVLHDREGALAMAQPVVPLTRRLTDPAARRYLNGWPSRDTIHVLSPRLLARRAVNTEGSRELERLAPAALLVQLVIGYNNPHLPPPFRIGALVRAVRWSWLVHGTAQRLSGQLPHARAAIVRRLREGRAPSFPPALRDAPLLGGTLVDLIAREEGEAAAIRLACRLPPGGPRESLAAVFAGRPVAQTERTWRAGLDRLAYRD